MGFAEILMQWREQAARKGQVLKVRLRLSDGGIVCGNASFIGKDFVTLGGAKGSVSLVPLTAIVSVVDVTHDDGNQLTDFS